MKKQILKYSLIFLTLLSSFFAWLSVDQAINNPESGDWLIPIVWFSLVFIAFSLSIILIKEIYTLAGLLTVSFLASFIFIQNSWHFLPVVFSLLLVFLAVIRIRGDLKLNIKIDLWKTVRRGKLFLIVALSIVITSQYYFSVKDFGAGALIPQLKPGDITNNLTTKIISMVNPGIKIGGDENMTVDQFILQSQENINSINNEPMVLEEGRKQLSDIAGKELTGEEKISEVISEMINNKITDFLGVSMDSPKEAPLIPIALAIIIFLTVVSLGYFLSPLWILLTALIFTTLVKTKIVRIKKVPVEMEVIE